MKKLLNLLAITGLVASATTTVVACGSKKDDTPEPEIDRSQIIREFEEEINKIIKEHIKSRISSLTVYDIGSGKLEFLNKQTLESKKEESGKIKINNDEKTKLIKDFHGLMAIEELETKINGLALKEQWSLILSNLSNKVFGEINFIDGNEIQLKANGSGNNFFASVDFGYEFQIYYHKNDIEIAQVSIQKKNFEFLLTSHEDFHNAVQEMHEKIKDEIITMGITNKDLKFDKPEMKDLSVEIKDYYNQKNSNFRNDIPEKIQKKYFIDKETNPIKDITIGFSNGSNIVELNKDSWIHKYRSNTDSYNLYNVKNHKIDFYTSDEEKHNQDPELQEQKKKSKTRKILKLIYRNDFSNESKVLNDIKEIMEFKDDTGSTEYYKLDKAFSDEIEKELELNQLEQIGSKALDKISHLGIMEVDNLEAKVKVDNNEIYYKIPGSFSMYVSYLPITEGTRLESESLKDAIAKNVYEGIVAFRKHYEIISEPGGYPELDYIGVMSEQSEVYKLWKFREWNDKNLVYINQQINLKDEKLQKIRTSLLKESKQSHFEYTFVGNGPTKKSYIISPYANYVKLEYKKDNGSDPIYNYRFEMDYFRIRINFDTKLLLRESSKSQTFVVMGFRYG